eukprot:547658-Pyramimonas_sp.AAC.1
MALSHSCAWEQRSHASMCSGWGPVGWGSDAETDTDPQVGSVNNAFGPCINKNKQRSKVRGPKEDEVDGGYMNDDRVKAVACESVMPTTKPTRRTTEVTNDATDRSDDNECDDGDCNI